MERLILEQFKDFQINKKTLTEHLGTSPVRAKTSTPIYIDKCDVKRLLEQYQTKQLRLEEVLEWCDVIRFSELFEYPDEENEQEVIATVIDEIQDIEGIDNTIPTKDVSRWLGMLKNI